MAQMYFMSVNAPGLQVTTGAAAVASAIPVNAAGRLPKHVRLMALASCYVRPSTSVASCTVNDILLSPNEQIVLDVAGFTHISNLQDTAAAKFNITPLET